MAYKLILKQENGDVMLLATVDDLERAKQLLESFKENWPGDYSIVDSESNEELE
jgi:hypothetical protein